MPRSPPSGWPIQRPGMPATPIATGSTCMPATNTRSSPARWRRRSTNSSPGAAGKGASPRSPRRLPPPPGSKPISGRWVSMPLADIALAGHPADHRVVVAMSGGVDSSVTAALVTRAGFDVVGITLQLYDHGAATGRKGACCAGQDVRDAARVAARLGIPHYVLD